jgi:hypothetical protein
VRLKDSEKYAEFLSYDNKTARILGEVMTVRKCRRWPERENESLDWMNRRAGVPLA